MRLHALLPALALLLPSCADPGSEACDRFQDRAVGAADELLGHVGEIPFGNYDLARAYCMDQIEAAGWEVWYKRPGAKNPDISTARNGTVTFAVGMLDRTGHAQARSVCHEWTHVASELHWGTARVAGMYTTASGRAGIEMAAYGVEMAIFDATHLERRDAFRLSTLEKLEDNYGPWLGRIECLEQTTVPYWDELPKRKVGGPVGR